MENAPTNTWPMGQQEQDPDRRGLVFHPTGYLVAVLEDDEEAERGRDALERAGFSSDDLRVYTGPEILEDHRRFLQRRRPVEALIGSLLDDTEARDQYLRWAEQGRAALWARVPTDHDATRAIKALADFHALHLRHYGHDSITDIQTE